MSAEEKLAEIMARLALIELWMESIKYGRGGRL
jgi:hypothetical protein